MYERASTWVKRRASAAEVAAARLLSLTMRSKATPGNRRALNFRGRQTADREPLTSKYVSKLTTYYSDTETDREP